MYPYMNPMAYTMAGPCMSSWPYYSGMYGGWGGYGRYGYGPNYGLGGYGGGWYNPYSYMMGTYW